jgi:Tol biopolymer transport system component
MSVVPMDVRRWTSTALAAALLVPACGTPTEVPRARTAPAPSLSQSAAGAVPEIFAPNVISDGNEQWRITFSPDGKTAYFAESPEFFPFTRRATIYVSHFVDGAWTEPVVAPFSGVYSDIDPFLSPNGKRLYFSSIRPVDGVPRTDIDIWMVERTAEGWGEPIHLGPEVNSPNADELYPSVSARGTLYFASGPFFPQAGRHWDIYRAERDGSGFAPREALGPGVNTAPSASDPHLQAAWEFNPEISVDGRTLVFTSLRPGGFGLGDLYVSRLVKGEWTLARNLGPTVNTASDEYHPTLSRNGRKLYFVRRIPARGNFYVVSTSALDLRKR